MKVSPARALPWMFLGAALLLGACGEEAPGERLDRLAERYVRLALELDRLRPGEVDVFFGPQYLRRQDGPGNDSFAEIAGAAGALRSELAGEATPRGRRLQRRVAELEAAAQYLADPARWTYPEQARALYRVAWVDTDDERIETALAAIDAALPGRGSVRARMTGLRRRLVIPAEKRAAVFEAAVKECRKRTRAHWALPDDEHVDLEWTRDVDAAWHRFDGAARSTLRVNALAIASVDQALDVACHESYPGHHAQFVLFEAAAGAGGLALEDTLVLLRSPASALREGAAVAAVDLVFPQAERLAFEREVLVPLAGLSVADTERYAAVRPHLAQLANAIPSIIADHEDRALSDAEAINRLQSEALVASPRALFAFAHEVGAYLAGYTLVSSEVDARLKAGSKEDAWEQLRHWLEDPDAWPGASSQGLAQVPR